MIARTIALSGLLIAGIVAFGGAVGTAPIAEDVSAVCQPEPKVEDGPGGPVIYVDPCGNYCDTVGRTVPEKVRPDPWHCLR